MLPDGLLGCLSAAGHDRLHDLPMLRDVELAFGWIGEGQMAYPIQMRLGRVDDAPGQGMATDPEDGAVKSVVELVESIKVARVACFGLAPEVDEERGHERFVGRGARVARGSDFQDLAHELGFDHRIDIDPGDQRAKLGEDADKPFCGQPDEGLANRRSADTELVRNVLLRQRLTRRHMNGHDALSKDAMDLRGDG